MKATTQRITVSTSQRGHPVAPDQLLVPVQLHIQAATPTAAAARLCAVIAEIEQAAGASVRHEGTRSWTEKLLGKRVLGRELGAGVTHHIHDVCVCVVQAPTNWGFAQRIQEQEALRERLAALAMDDEVQLGEARWVVSQPEAHRERLLQALRQEVDLITHTLGLPVTGATLDPITVTVHGPAHAELTIASEWTIGAGGSR